MIGAALDGLGQMRLGHLGDDGVMVAMLYDRMHGAFHRADRVIQNRDAITGTVEREAGQLAVFEILPV